MKISYNIVLLTLALFMAGCSSFHAVYTSPFDRDKEQPQTVIVPNGSCVFESGEPINYGSNPPPSQINIDNIRPAKEGKDYNEFVPTERMPTKQVPQEPEQKKDKPTPPAKKVPEKQENDSRPPRHYEELQYASASFFFGRVWRVFI